MSERTVEAESGTETDATATGDGTGATDVGTATGGLPDDTTAAESTAVRETAAELPDDDLFDGPVPDDAAGRRTTVDPGTETATDGADYVATGRWAVGVPVAMVAGTVALLAPGPGPPVALATAVVGLAFAAYGYATRPPAPAVVVNRAVTDTSPLPGGDVTVALTVENVSDRTVADLRLVDRVPDDLELVEGSATHSATLAPGETDRVEYTLRARRGDHAVGPATLVLRNLSGSEAYRRDLDDPVSLSVRASPDGVALDEQTAHHTGRVETDEPGSGIEFHSTREYHPSDPMRRIDWNRYASTGDLRTVAYGEERAAVVVVAVDLRPAADVARTPSEPTGTELCEYAGEQVARTLLDRNDRVGVLLYGDGRYLPPATGRVQSLRIRTLLREGPDALTADDLVDVGYRHDTSVVRDRLPPEAQVVFVSALTDDAPVESVAELEAYGHPTRVIAPDLTAADTVGGTVARVERTDRVSDLRTAGVEVAEWSPDEPLRTAIARAERRWSS